MSCCLWWPGLHWARARSPALGPLSRPMTGRERHGHGAKTLFLAGLDAALLYAIMHALTCWCCYMMIICTRSAAPDSTAEHQTTHQTAQHSTAHSTAWSSTAQHSTAEHSASSCSNQSNHTWTLLLPLLAVRPHDYELALSLLIILRSNQRTWLIALHGASLGRRLSHSPTHAGLWNSRAAREESISSRAAAIITT